VPTIRFQVLYVFLVLAHDRRRILHFAVTAHPTAEWTALQLREAFPWDSAPRFLLRDRDCIFGADFTQQVKALGIQEVLGAPRAPRRRAYIERVSGTIRRECLDHVIVFNEASWTRRGGESAKSRPLLSPFVSLNSAERGRAGFPRTTASPNINTSCRQSTLDRSVRLQCSQIDKSL
jgi:transposase InsO family protein